MENYSERLKEHLLGGLPPTDADEIDYALIDGRIGIDDIKRAEDELIEDYLEHRLPPPKARLFQEVFLSSAKHRTNVLEIAALRRVARVEASSGEILAPDRSERRYFLFFSPRNFAYAGIAAAVCVILISAILALTHRGSGADIALQKHYSELNQRDTPSLNAFPQNSVVSVFPSRTRASSGDRINVLRPGSGDILFRLSLPFSTDGLFRITVKQAGKEKLAIENLRPEKNELRVVLPRSLFERGDATLTLQDMKAENLPIVYDLTVD